MIATTTIPMDQFNTLFIRFDLFREDLDGLFGLGKDI